MLADPAAGLIDRLRFARHIVEQLAKLLRQAASGVSVQFRSGHKVTSDGGIDPICDAIRCRRGCSDLIAMVDQMREWLNQEKRWFLRVIWTLAIFIALCVSTMAAWHLTQASFGKEQDIAIAGQRGDSYGGVTAVFSALAFLGLIATIVIQQKQGDVQQKQLELQHEEILRNKKEQQQAEAVQLKSIEVLEKQAESLLLTAFLNAKVAARDTPSPETIPAEQWNAAVAIQEILNRMEPRANAILGLSPSKIQHQHHIAVSIRRLKRIFEAYIPIERENCQHNLFSADQMKRHLCHGLRKNMDTIAGQLNEEHVPEIKNAFEAMGVVEQYVFPSNETPTVEQYKGFWTACQTVSEKLEDLAFGCES